MKFMPNTILSILALLITAASGEGDGSTTCHSTSTIPGSFHGNDPAGTLTDGGFEVLVDDQIMSLTGSNILTSGAHSITVRQTNGGTFMGLYMWGSSNDALSASSTDTSVKGGKTWTVGGNNVSCSSGSSALTHTGIKSKTQSSGTLTMPASGSVEVQVQPMTSFFSGSTYYWSSITFEVEVVTSSPTKSPTASPTKSPTKAPTQSPTKGPTKVPTQSPTKSPSEAPSNIPTKAPVTSSPTRAPVINPVTANPTKAPVSSVPVTSNPTKSPTASPTAAPVTTSPTKAPTVVIASSNPTVTVSSSSPTEIPVVIAPPSPGATTPEPSYEYDDDEDDDENDDDGSASGSVDHSSGSISGSSNSADDSSDSNDVRTLGTNLRGSK